MLKIRKVFRLAFRFASKLGKFGQQKRDANVRTRITKKYMLSSYILKFHNIYAIN